MTYYKDGKDQMGAKVTHEYSGFPPIHCFDRRLQDTRPETGAPNNLVHGSQDEALCNEGVTTALGSGGGTLMTT